MAGPEANELFVAGLPRVAVVIITYHGDAYVEKAIRSVLGQTLRDLELCVVEDGSRDRTESIIRSLGDDRVRYVWRPNGGLSAARNTGIAATTAPYVAFLDCDDWWEPEKLAAQVAVLERDPEIGLVYSSGRSVDETGALVASIPARVEGDVLRDLLLGQCLAGSASSVMVRRSLLARAGTFDETVRYAEDWECWVRLAALTRVGRVVEPHVWLLMRKQSFGKQTDEIRKSARKFLDAAFTRHAPKYDHLRSRAYARLEYVSSIDFLKRGNRSESMRALLRAIRHAPLEWSAYARLLLMLLRRI